MAVKSEWDLNLLTDHDVHLVVHLCLLVQCASYPLGLLLKTDLMQIVGLHFVSVVITFITQYMHESGLLVMISALFRVVAVFVGKPEA